MTTRQRFHDETDTGALGTPSSGMNARVSYQAFYYDAADRLVGTVDVGTNGGSVYTRPEEIPDPSDTELVTTYAYNDAGWVETVTDPREIVGKTYYDALGRTTKTIENYVNGAPSDTDDKTVEYTYDPSGNMKTLTVDLPGGGVQTTEWVYGTTGTIVSNDILAEVRHPDPTTGAPSTSETDQQTVNALGEVVTTTDRNGNVHTLSYDVLGRLTKDAVTTLGAGVNGAVRRIEYAYDGQGNVALITSYDAASSGNIVNQVQREFNGLGQLTTEYQEHSGAVDTDTSLKVQYTYSEMAGGANHSRLTSMTYPNGKELDYNYDSGLDSNISRLSSLSDNSGTLESYNYLGLATVVRRSHPQPEIDLTYIKLSGESNGDAGDQYIGLDRFGRVVDQRWYDTDAETETDRFQNGYDRNGNRTFRDNLVNTDFGELYTYDGLNQLASFQRGELDGTRTDLTGAASREQEWDYDALGNWDSVTTDSVAQTRTHNKQNEIGSVSGATTPTYDANGNLTKDETGKQFVYDAWNRLVEVKDSGGSSIVTYEYDAIFRRVSETKSGTTREFYHSDQWQVLEERVGGNTQMQYIWSPVYVDALVLRDRDTDANGSLDERLWVQQDANFNVTALVDGSGAVVERYAYDPFGKVTVLDANWATDGDGMSDVGFVHLHQGGRFDNDTGLYEFRNRFSSATLGRWLQVDPLGFGAGDLNYYRGLGNNSGNSLDASGLSVPLSDLLGRTILKPIRYPGNRGWTVNSSDPTNQQLNGMQRGGQTLTHGSIGTFWGPGFGTAGAAAAAAIWAMMAKVGIVSVEALAATFGNRLATRLAEKGLELIKDAGTVVRRIVEKATKRELTQAELKALEAELNATRRLATGKKALRQACRELGVDEKKASDTLHRAKHAAGRGGNDNVSIDLDNGDIIAPETGEVIGNIVDPF